jgi:hypothetical protein
METVTSPAATTESSAPKFAPCVSKKARIVGWIMTILPALMFLFSAVMKFSQNPEVQKGFEHVGWPANLAVRLGILELTCTIIYLFPRAAILGAILLTGYLGGAIATHVRIGEPVVTHIILGIVLWGGIFLRDPRLRALIPLRR